VITGIHHTCLTVSDLERSIDFYSRFLDAEVVWDSEAVGLKLEGPMADMVTGCPGTSQRVVYLQAGGDLFELMAFTPTGRQPEGNLSSDVGSPHVCFLTDDIDELYERLLAADVVLHCPPQDLGDTRLFYFRDPDGIILEAMGGTPTVEGPRSG